MNRLHSILLWGVCLIVAASGARGAEAAQPEAPRSWQALGPFLFDSADGEGGTACGLRPLFVERRRPATGWVERSVLYPVFTYRSQGDRWDWSVLSLINRKADGTEAVASAEPRGFDAWPVYFSRDTGNPETSYHAVFPLGGAMTERLGFERLEWLLFPLYGRSVKQGKTVTTMPWPFIKSIRGEGYSGWALWPLVGRDEKAGEYRSQYLFWPLIYRDASRLGEARPAISHGFLPFYTRDESPEITNTNVLWPFFGTTERREPYRYQETRYFWPFLVQGRGADHYRNRWGPFYTHSVWKGSDKTWIAFPLWRRERWQGQGLEHTKSQFLYFLYWSLEQRRPGQGDNAPAASMTHLWPLMSSWDNGAGRRQLQILSPFEVFFPTNDTIRVAYTPIFALYRFNQTAPGAVSRSFLFDLVATERSPASGSRTSFLFGLVSFVRPAPDGPLRIHFMDFKKMNRPGRLPAPPSAAQTAPKP
jgi:hypothetical protein